MPITSRGTKFQATVNFQNQRHRKSFGTHLEATTWESKTKEALKRGESIIEGVTAVKGHPATLQALFELTERKYWTGTGGGEAACINAAKCLQKLGSNLPPSEVTAQRLDDMIYAFEAEGLAPATINRRLSAISKMLSFAYDRGYIDRKPKIERKREPNHRVRYITGGEEAELFAYYKFIGKPEMADFCAFMIDTGLRLGESLALKVKNLNKDGVLEVHRSKTKSWSYIPLTTRALAVFKKQAAGAENVNSKIWGEYTNDRIRHLWNGARSHLGLMTDPQFVPHCMRHTFCSRLVQRGVDIVSVKELAGHKNITMTMRYAHLKPSNLVNAIRALEAIEEA